ncbi:class I SAM-dependent methyltransferase [Alkalibacterium iburiense]|uniref:Class I SAM-dependent methyltransferase n=1 Tax=Alkalibacterium iburiense TaxID=290589 RepID=A0ABN0XHY5_9LACT
MDTKKIELFFNTLNDSAKLIQADLDSTYIEALIETGENLIDGGNVHVEEGKPNPGTVDKLKNIYAAFDLSTLSMKERKQAIQFILIQASKEDNLQPNHQPTPDAIGVLLSHLIALFKESRSSIHLADFSVGTGNLLYTIYTTLYAENNQVKLTGIDNDDLLLSLASTLSALLEIPIELMLQDAIQSLLVDPVDILVSDLPVGYYPRELKQTDYETAFKEGYSYSHFLLIEQGLNYLKEGGYSFFLLPTRTFESEEVKELLSFVQKVGHVQAVIHLPTEWFKNEQSKKSLFVVQKKGEDSKQAKEVLIANAPAINDKEAFNTFIVDVKNWKEEQGFN